MFDVNYVLPLKKVGAGCVDGVGVGAEVEGETVSPPSPPRATVVFPPERTNGPVLVTSRYHCVCLTVRLGARAESDLQRTRPGRSKQQQQQQQQ